MRAATTKIPHLLYEKDLLKNPESDVWLYLQIMIYLQWIYMMGMGEKPHKYVQTKNKEKFPVWLTSHPYRLRKWRPTVFRCPKTPKTSGTYPRWDWDLTLVG